MCHSHTGEDNQLTKGSSSLCILVEHHVCFKTTEYEEKSFSASRKKIIAEMS